MAINTLKYIDKLKIYVSLVILLSVAIVDVASLHFLQLDKREQARNNLNHTINCLKTYEELLNVSIDRVGMKLCTFNMLTSPTGDMQIIDIETRERIYDTSKDVPEDSRYFTKESVGKHFSDWKSAEVAMAKALSNTSSTVHTNAWYNYDGSIEWIEYRPFETKDKRDIVIVQGIQQDEVYEVYSFVRKFAGTLAVIYAFSLISLAIIGRRHDNTRYADNTNKP